MFASVYLLEIFYRSLYLFDFWIPLRFFSYGPSALPDDEVISFCFFDFYEFFVFWIWL